MDVLLPQGRREYVEIDGRMQKVYVPDDSVCRVCQEDVVDGRWNYCSERCRGIANALQSMFIWDLVRDRVLERDDYTCQGCGLSRERWREANRRIRDLADEDLLHPRDEDTDVSWEEYRFRLDRAKERYGMESPEFHVDHIQRLTDGGHPLDESNLQTLCKNCHQEKTAAENSSKSARARPELGLDAYLE